MVVKYEQLGDIVSFNKNEVRVLSNLYNSVPTEFQEDFDRILESAMSAYYSRYEASKQSGVKVAPLSIKKQVIEEMITPFLDLHNLTNYQKSRIKVTRPSTPGIPKEEKVRVERKSPLVEISQTSNEISDIFDNFDWDSDFGTTVVEPELNVDTNEPEFDCSFGDLFEDEDKFDFSDLNF